MNIIQRTFYANIFQNSRRQKGDMRPVQYCGPTNIRHHLTKCTLPSDMVQPCVRVWVGYGYLFYLFIYFSLNSPDSLLGLMTCYGLEIQGSNSRRIKQYFSSPDRPLGLWGSATLLFYGYRSSFPGIKRPGRQDGHSPPFSADVKNERSYNSALSMCLHSADRDHCTVLYMSHWSQQKKSTDWRLTAEGRSVLLCPPSNHHNSHSLVYLKLCTYSKFIHSSI